MLVAFYLGEAGKLMIVALLFVFAFKRIPWVQETQMGLILLIGFIASQLMAWVYPLIKHRPGAN
jgi:F0F1-type ATP synthase assembly protein I